MPAEAFLHFDEVLPCLAAAFVVFHHGKFLGHVEADEVFIGGEASFVFAVDNFINGKVQSLLEAVFADPVFNPVRKLLLGFQEFPQITGVDCGDFVSVQSDSGCFDEFRCHVCSFMGLVSISISASWEYARPAGV